MNPLDRLKVIFGEAMLLPAGEREAFLDTACGEDTALRSEVEGLLSAYDRPGYTPPPEAETASIAAGTVLAGRYTLLEVIGEGGMGRVWRARQSIPVTREVAVKIVRAGRDSRAVVARFDAERQALAVMDHPGIARVYDGGTCSSAPFFVMELVRGTPINEYAKTLDTKTKIKLTAAVCRAVQHAHTKGVIHRDLKPANILVQTVDGQPAAKVIDFGVAKAVGERLTDESLADTGLLIGTPQYMAPEQAESSPDIDTRADVYALGAVLYELLAGKPPLAAGHSLLDLLKRIREEEPPPPGQGEIDWIVMKALAKRRDERYASADHFAADLERYLADEPVEARPPSRGYKLRKFIRRNRGAVVAASLVLLSLIGGIVASLLALKEAREQERGAVNARNEAEQSAEAAITAKNEEAKQRAAAIDERDQALAMRNFLRLDLLQQADAKNRADDLRRNREYQANPRIRDLLDRAAEGLAPDRIAERFPNKSTQGAILSTVGDTYLLIGEYDKAASLLDRVSKLAAEVHGPEADQTLTARYNLGLAHLYANRDREAGVIFEEVWTIRKRQSGAEDKTVLNVQNAVATAWTKTGRLAEGIALLEATRDTLIRTVGPDHQTTRAVLNNLAGSWQQQRNIAKAVAQFEENLAVETRLNGPEHPATLAAKSTLALALNQAGRGKEAAAMLEEVLASRLKVLGPDHHNTATTYKSLARIWRQLRDWPKAVAYAEKAHDAFVRLRGADDADTLILANGLAWVYHKNGQSDKAVRVYEQTITAQTRTLGRGHSDTLTAITNLGFTLDQLGEYDRAGKLLAEAAAGSEALKFDHANSEIILETYIGHLIARRDFAKAIIWRRKLADRIKAVNGAESMDYGIELYKLVSLLSREEKWADAEPVYREMHAIIMKIAPTTYSRYNIESELGWALFKLGRPKEAEPLLLSGGNGLKAMEAEIPADSKPFVPLALDRLIEFNEAANRQEEVAKWRALRSKYPQLK